MGKLQSTSKPFAAAMKTAIEEHKKRQGTGDFELFVPTVAAYSGYNMSYSVGRFAVLTAGIWMARANACGG